LVFARNFETHFSVKWLEKRRRYARLGGQYEGFVERMQQVADDNLLDAPCTGSKNGAESGNLTFMVGGDEAVFERVRSFFEPMGKMLYYCGGSGMGLHAKLSQNLYKPSSRNSAAMCWLSVGAIVLQSASTVPGFAVLTIPSDQ
jgi:hypothetical protein